MNLQELKDQLAKNKAELKIVYDQRDRLNEEAKQILIDIYGLETGLKIGDDVEFKDGKEMKKGRLTSLRVRYESVEPVITLYKKDGTLGERTKDWFYDNKFTKIKLMLTP